MDKLLGIIRAHNGVVNDHITDKIDYLICNDTTSDAAQKAVALGIKVITEEHFKDMIGGLS